MAITINWPTQVINVPRADMTLLQSTPEIRELNLNQYRLELKSLEDDAEGISFLRTHKHNTEVTLAGLIYARIVEIINGYTVEFEDGQYAVNCVGANHNLSDVKVANQVSLIVNNAAGLISNAAIEYSSFGGGVTVDVTSDNDGTVFPTGTPQAPVNNLADAMLIAGVRGFTTLFINGDITIDTSGDYEDMVFIGESQTKTIMTISDGANVLGCEFKDATVLGTLDGNSLIQNCVLSTLDYVYGIIVECILEPGTITLGGTNPAHFLDCWTGDPSDGWPTIDCGGAGQALALQNYNGRVKITNKTGSQQIQIALNAGEVWLDSTVTNGTIYLSGVGTLIDDSTGSAVVEAELLSQACIADSVWNEPYADHQVAGTFGAFLLATLGLSGENTKWSSLSHDAYNNLTGATITQYTDDTLVTPIKSWTLTATYNANSELTAYQMVEN